MFKIAVIQLDAIDNLIFSAPAIIGLKRRHADSTISVFVNEESRAALAGWEIVDSVYPIDTKKLIEFSKNNVATSVNEIFDSQVISKSEKFDLVVNLSGSNIANLLATYLEAPKRIGPYFNSESEVQIDNIWSQYQASVIGRSILNPFHLADVYKYITRENSEDSAIDIAPYPDATQKAKTLIGDIPGMRIGLIISSQWPMADSIAYAEEILGSIPRSRIFLLPPRLDGEISSHSAQKFIDATAIEDKENRVLDFTGINDFSSLHALINEMHIVVGPLTISSHLAVACGTFSISLAFLDQYLYERGPYGHGHLVVADENSDAESLSVPWLLVAHLTRAAISTNGTKPPTLEQWQAICDGVKHDVSPQFKVLHSSRLSFHQQDGVERIDTVLEPILSHGSTMQEAMMTFYRLVWQFDLNASEDTVTNLHVERTSTIGAMMNLVDALEKLHKIATFGASFCRYVQDDLKKNNLELARQDSEKLQEIDNLIEKMGSEVPAVAPLCNYYSVSQYQNRNPNPIKVAELAQLTYERLQVQISIILDLVQEMVTKNKSEEVTPRSPEVEIR